MQAQPNSKKQQKHQTSQPNQKKSTQEPGKMKLSTKNIIKFLNTNQNCLLLTLTNQTPNYIYTNPTTEGEPSKQKVAKKWKSQ